MKNTNKVKDLTGMKFGRLTVLKIDEGRSGRKTFWICQCDCGNIKSVRSDSLQSGRIKSCGCLKRKTDAENLAKAHKHKMSKTPLYNVWQNMKSRCYNENDTRFADWGGRGICVCDEWRHDFMAFYDWAVTHGYSDGLTIDRIDNDGNYCPENCRWATMKEQENNRSNSRLFTMNGKTQTLALWCDEYGQSYKTIYKRIFVLGWDFEKAITSPIDTSKRNNLTTTKEISRG